jgi:hypothetical protein
MIGSWIVVVTGMKLSKEDSGRKKTEKESNEEHEKQYNEGHENRSRIDYSIENIWTKIVS